MFQYTFSFVLVVACIENMTMKLLGMHVLNKLMSYQIVTQKAISICISTNSMYLLLLFPTFIDSIVLVTSGENYLMDESDKLCNLQFPTGRINFCFTCLQLGCTGYTD